MISICRVLLLTPIPHQSPDKFLAISHILVHTSLYHTSLTSLFTISIRYLYSTYPIFTFPRHHTTSPDFPLISPLPDAFRCPLFQYLPTLAASASRIYTLFQICSPYRPRFADFTIELFSLYPHRSRFIFCPLGNVDCVHV